MADPVISPDGKFMWTGSEWIDAPPSKEISLHDSVVQGDVSINTEVHHHHGQRLEISDKKKPCSNCGEEDTILKPCSGIYKYNIYMKEKKCVRKGCDFCFQKLHTIEQLKDRYYCVECHRENSRNLLVTWLLMLIISIIFVVMLVPSFRIIMAL